MSPAQPAEPVELNLLRPWREPVSPRRFLRDALGSLAVHATVLALLFFAPEVKPVGSSPVITADLKHAVPLVAPRYFEPTQKQPNHGKVTRELDVNSAVQGAPAQTPRFRPPIPAPGPPAPVPAAPLVEAPKIEVAAAAAPQPSPVIGPPATLPPPSAEKPKIALENVPGSSSVAARTNPNPNVKLDTAKPSLEELARAAARPGGAGGLTVGDIGEFAPDIPGLNQAPSECRTCSTLQLLSDPQNVDFQPYLIKVLGTVKRNWLAVIPESARMGRRGTVLIQFIIDRRGGVPKLVIASPSGTEAFDRAAVAGVSASYPFPPLPAEYKGDQIRLQLAFDYNVRRR